MGILQHLSALTLRQLTRQPPDPAGGESVGSPGNGPPASQRLERAFHRTSDNAWLALEILLAGEDLWEHVQSGPRRPGDPVLLQLLRRALDSVSLRLGGDDGFAAEQRRECLRELQFASRGRLLSGGSVELTELNWLVGTFTGPADATELSDGEWQALRTIADELRRMGHQHLAELVGRRPRQGIPILVTLVRYFFQREIEADRTLAERLVAASPGLTSPAEAHGLAALAEIVLEHRPRLTRWLDEVRGTALNLGEQGLQLEPEHAAVGSPMLEIAQEALQLLKALQIDQRPLTIRDSLSVDDAVQAKIQELAARFRSLPDEERQLWPALIHALGKLEMAAGIFEAAEQDFEETTTLVKGGKAQAEAFYHAFLAGLERRDWTEALANLRQAMPRDPGRFALFPLEEYEPERILGATGAVVKILCQSRATNASVVVKTLWPENLDRPVDDLFRDLRALDELQQPALPRLLACGYVDQGRQRPFIVREYFEGTSLAEEVVHRGPLTPEDLAAVVRPLVETLRTIHSRGLIHGMIRPDNLIVQRTETGWQVKLIDFGLMLRSSLIHGVSANPAVRSRTLLGEGVNMFLDYAAPEQLGRGDTAVVGPAADVYGFGKSCYFALLGTAEPDDDDKERLPAFWRKLLGACTARSVAKRLADFDAVAERLQEFTPAAPPAARPAPPAAAAAEPRRSAYLPPDLACIQRGLTFHHRGEWEKAIAEFTAALQHNPSNAAALVHRADSRRQRGELESALADYAEALRLDPANVLAWLNQGIVHRQLGDNQAAIADYTEALKLDPANALAYNNRGNAHADLGNFEQAIADYSEAIRLDPQYAKAYQNRGNAYADLEDYERAIADFTKSLLLDPKQPICFVARGEAYQLQGDLERAIADFTEALRLDANYTLAYLSRGDAFRQKGDLDRALADYTEALGLDPTNAVLYCHRGIAYRQKGDLDRALADLTRAVRLDPELALAWSHHGNVCLARGELDQAVTDFTEAIRLEPEQATNYVNRALALAKKGDHVSVIRDCNAALHLDAKLPVAWFVRGVAHSQLQDFDRAIADFTRAIQLDPRYVLAYNDRGLALVHKREYDQAIADYTEALRLDPRYAVAYANRGIAHRLKGQLDAAIADFTRALRCDSKLVLAYQQRGLAYLAKDDHDRAIADFTLALRLDPRNKEVYALRDKALKAKTEAQKSDKERRRLQGQSRAEEERRQREAAAYFIRGKTHFDKNEYEPAIAAFSEAIRIDPQDAQTYHLRAQCHFATDALDQALADWTSAIKLSPRNAEFYLRRGIVRRRLEQFDAAIADFSEALKLDPGLTEAFTRRDEATRARQEKARAEKERPREPERAPGAAAKPKPEKLEIDRAIAKYTEAIRRDPSNAAAFRTRGYFLEQKGDLQRALADYSEAIRLQPRDVVSFLSRANVYITLGEHDKALQDLRHVVRLDPDNARASYLRGLIHMAKDEIDAAIVQFTQAIRRDPNLAEAYSHRGRAYRLRAEHDKAIADCSEAIRLDPTNARAYHNRSMARAAKGEHAQARADYEEAIRLDPMLAQG